MIIIMYNYVHKTQCIYVFGYIQKMFFKFDKNRSGTLERQEVYSAVMSLGENSYISCMNLITA